ncbi:elongation factor G 2 [Striga asiatica]|uniref:Elongation factor G 2 n=1 Tax=Striga asiatica TaxID=4170 RepID=A0A5A7QQ30_STRAF|nr:elongation factor G 2 [Striga asiatica]
MRREGRPHGMVRTCPSLSAPCNPPPNSRILNQLSGPPTAGLFTKVPSRPTNHSKFTGKCGRPRCRACHVGPACKSRTKAKGAHKTRSAAVDFSDDDCDVYGSDYRSEDFDSDADEYGLSSRDKFSSESVVDDDKMSYFEVGISCGSEDGEEGWCLVEDKSVICC